MASPAPKSPELSEKSKKYDRQLRLWGDHGQSLLENAKVCLINATALGTEILKSLVLPGIGAFTIVDSEKITEEDIGSNFFLDADSVGMSRAKIATQLLLDLNPEVRGDYIDESPEHVLSHSQNFYNNFDVVIGTALSEKLLIPLSKHLWEANVPLIVCRSIGFVGYVRLQVKEHTVIETHPDNEILDLRLTNPWPELKVHLEKIDISKLDHKERSHVPAIVILYYFFTKFLEGKNGALPVTRQDKDRIREMIRESAIVNENGVAVLEENFEEAIRFVNTCLKPDNIPPSIEQILEDDSCTNLSRHSRSFWITCAALREFVHSENSLPVRGTLPDMASDSESFITLQQIYQNKARGQAESVYRRACQIVQNLGLPQEVISEQEVKLICKHSSELCVIRGTCIANEYEKSTPDLSSHLEDHDSLMFYYVLLRGLERFLGEFNTYPGQFDDQVEPDVLKLKLIIGKFLNEWGCAQILSEERVHEICRYGGAELHSVSAILGGIVAQEVIKLITHQYKPLDNTFIYDAVTSNSASYTL